MKINVTKTSALDKAINEAEGKSTQRTMSTDEVLTLIEKIEETLSIIAPKPEWINSEFELTYGGKVPSSYFGVANATFVTIKRFPSGWFATNIERKPLKSKDIYPKKLPKLNESHHHQLRIFN